MGQEFCQCIIMVMDYHFLLLLMTICCLVNEAENLERRIVPLLDSSATVSIGNLYNAYKDQPISHRKLFKDKDKSVTGAKINYYEKEYKTDQSLKDRLSFMDINANIKLSFLGGLFSVSGSAGYLHDEQQYESNE